MKNILYFTLILILLFSCKKEEVVSPVPLISEVKLQPFIGLNSLPNNSDVICPIPNYTTLDFESNAIPVDNSAFDFTLYNQTGKAFNLKNILETNKKPVLLFSGSWTCPVFRNKIAHLNKLIEDYGTQIDFFQIYVVEPHPYIDISPYRGTVWTTNKNISSGILYRQPTTYGERLAIAQTMKDSLQINCETLIDGPCNEYWLNFGEAPNRSYLIDKQGKIVASHGWFDYYTMKSSIDVLLNE